MIDVLSIKARRRAHGFHTHPRTKADQVPSPRRLHVAGAEAEDRLTLLALVADRAIPEGIALREVTDPSPTPSQALIEVRATSLKRGEVRDLDRRPDGDVHGWTSPLSMRSGATVLQGDSEAKTGSVDTTRSIGHGKDEMADARELAVGRDDGEARWWFGSLAVIKATAADTGGQVGIVEITEPPGAEAPLHVHHREDEGFWVLEGDVSFEVGGTTFGASAGDFAFGPRDVPHRYKVGDRGCRMLFILTPGGFEGAIMLMSTPARSRTLPPPSEAPPDMSELQATIASYDCEMLS